MLISWVTAADDVTHVMQKLRNLASRRHRYDARLLGSGRWNHSLPQTQCYTAIVQADTIIIS